MIRFLPRFLLLSLVLFISHGLRAETRRYTLTPGGRTTVVNTEQKVDPEQLTEIQKDTVLIYSVHPKGQPDKIIQLLEKHPDFKMVLVFPAHYLTTNENRSSINSKSCNRLSKSKLC
jgi:hypothetical protein